MARAGSAAGPTRRLEGSGLAAASDDSKRETSYPIMRMPCALLQASPRVRGGFRAPEPAQVRCADDVSFGPARARRMIEAAAALRNATRASRDPRACAPRRAKRTDGVKDSPSSDRAERELARALLTRSSSPETMAGVVPVKWTVFDLRLKQRGSGVPLSLSRDGRIDLQLASGRLGGHHGGRTAGHICGASARTYGSVACWRSRRPVAVRRA